MDYGIAPPAYRLPEATRVGPVRLQVSDLDRSIAYYETVLGLRAASRDGGAVLMAAGQEAVPLIWLHGRPAARPVPPGGALGLYHFALLLPDRASLGRFLSHVGSLGLPIGMADHAVSEALYLTDPDGLGIEVYADRPRSTWRHDAGQLYMTTEPLDVRGVADAGQGAAWAGMPDGTSMGHVHLHVGDLDGAAAFYHRALGLDKIVWGYPGALFMSAGGYHHHLGTNTWSRGRPAADDEARLLAWELIVPGREDRVAAAASLEAAGYAVRDADGAAVAADPWGTQVRIAVG